MLTWLRDLNRELLLLREHGQGALEQIDGFAEWTSQDGAHACYLDLSGTQTFGDIYPSQTRAAVVCAADWQSGQLHCRYNGLLFEPFEVQALLQAVSTALIGICQQPEQAVSQVSLLDRLGREAILAQASSSQANPDRKERNLFSLFKVGQFLISTSH